LEIDMNCLEAEKNFAALLDDSLDYERLREIKDHLNACSRCSEELTGLAESQRLVKGLQPVEAPLGFTTRVMAEVREIAHRPTLWQRLFLSFPTKLPLHATAVVLISVLAAYLYQKESRNGEPARTAPPASSFQSREETDRSPSSPAQAPAVESKAQVADEAGAQGRREKRSSAPEQPRPLPESEEQNKNIDGIKSGAAAMAPTQDHGSPALTTQPPNEKSLSGDEAASDRLEQSLPSEEAQAKGVPPPGSLQGSDTALKDATPAVKSPASGALLEKRAAPSLDALRSAAALSPNHELTLRLKQSARDDKNTAARPQLERFQAEPQTSTSGAEFKELEQARQRAIKTGQPQTLWTTIPSGQYDRFKSELAGFGNIESELPPPAPEKEAVSKSSEQLRIKLIILPPLPLAEALPAQESSR
jgi:hypothetical protein